MEQVDEFVGGWGAVAGADPGCADLSDRGVFELADHDRGVRWMQREPREDRDPHAGRDECLSHRAVVDPEDDVGLDPGGGAGPLEQSLCRMLWAEVGE